MPMQGNGGADEGQFRAGEEPVLIRETDRLPWLEGDEEPEQITVDTGRVLALGLIALLVMVVIMAALWWMMSDRAGDGVQEEGTTIQAPDEPYKTRPEDPGGREVAGTGDTSFRVAEGQAAGGRIEELPSVPAPEESEPEAETRPAAPADRGPQGVGVQVGAYSTRATAQSGWVQLINRFEILQGREHRIVEGRVDNAIVYRLQAVTADEDSADMLCESLKAEGGDCQVKR